MFCSCTSHNYLLTTVNRSMSWSKLRTFQKWRVASSTLRQSRTLPPTSCPFSVTVPPRKDTPTGCINVSKCVRVCVCVCMYMCVCACMCMCVCYAWILVDVYIMCWLLLVADNIFHLDVHYVCCIMLLSAFSHRVGALQISIMIIICCLARLLLLTCSMMIFQASGSTWSSCTTWPHFAATQTPTKASPPSPSLWPCFCTGWHANCVWRTTTLDTSLRSRPCCRPRCSFWTRRSTQRWEHSFVCLDACSHLRNKHMPWEFVFERIPLCVWGPIHTCRTNTCPEKLSVFERIPFCVLNACSHILNKHVPREFFFERIPLCLKWLFPHSEQMCTLRNCFLRGFLCVIRACSHLVTKCALKICLCFERLRIPLCFKGPFPPCEKTLPEKLLFFRGFLCVSEKHIPTLWTNMCPESFFESLGIPFMSLCDTIPYRLPVLSPLTALPFCFVWLLRLDYIHT